jgi:hypothetical protein
MFGFILGREILTKIPTDPIFGENLIKLSQGNFYWTFFQNFRGKSSYFKLLLATTHENGGRRPYRIDCRHIISKRTLWLRAGPPVVPPSREAIGAELH